MSPKKIIILCFLAIALLYLTLFTKTKHAELPLVAIANLGPHASLDASILGIKETLKQQGFIENKTVRYLVEDVGFDLSLIPQMINKLYAQHPRVMVVTTTPVAQYAKGLIKDVPLVFNVITDPVAAGLIKEPNKPDGNMTGSSDQQNLTLLLKLAKNLLPHASRVGILYSTAESNDLALVHMMQQAAKTMAMQVIAIPVNQARDVPQAMQAFKNKVDFIYVGASGAIQPTLPVIAAESFKMGIPVFNVEEDAVKKDLVLASFGVNYHKIGNNAGLLVSSLLQGKPLSTLTPRYPKQQDYQLRISKADAKALAITLPNTGGQ